MKSHLIPEPKPIEHPLSSTDAARMYLLDQIFSESARPTIAARTNAAARTSKAQAGSEAEIRPAPEMPMRNFLRVVFAG